MTRSPGPRERRGAIRTMGGDPPPPPSRSPARALVALAAVVAVILLLPLIRLPSGPQATDPTPPPTTEPSGEDRPIVELPLPLTAVIGSRISTLEGRLPAEVEELSMGADLHPVDLTADGGVLVLEGRLEVPLLVGPDGRRSTTGEASSDLRLSPDGRRLAVLDTVGRASVWESGGGLSELGEGPYRSLHWSPDSRLLGLQADSAYQVWDVREGRRLAESPGRILALGPDRAAVWRDGLLLVEEPGGRVHHGFPDLAPSLSAGVPGGTFDPSGRRLLLPALDGEGPGLFLIDPSLEGPLRLSRGEVTRPLFGWSGDGARLTWEEDGRLLRWDGDPGIPRRALGPLPGDALRLRLYDRALLPAGRLLLLGEGFLEERAPPAGPARLRPEAASRLVQAGPDVALTALEDPGGVSIRTVPSDRRGESLSEVPSADTLEAARSAGGTWGLAIDGGLRVITGGREYGPMDLGGSPAFSGEHLLYTDGDRILAIDTTRVPLRVTVLLEAADLPDAAAFLGVGVEMDRILVLVETREGSTALLGLPEDSFPELGSAPATELVRLAGSAGRLVTIPGTGVVAVQGSPARAVILAAGRTLWIEGRVLTVSPGGHWVLVERAGALVAVSTRGRGAVPLPGQAPDQAAWLGG